MAAGHAAGDADLVEREREVHALERVLDGALAGDGRVVFIEGPAGIGKSRLLQLARRRGEAAGRARARRAQLGARARVPLRRRAPAARRAARRPRACASARSQGAAAGARAVFEPAAGDDRDASFATLHGLYWLLLNLAGDRPLVLAVDDLHWCDRPSLRFLAYLTRRLEGLPILLAVTARSTEPGTDPALVGEIAADLATSPVRPGPLTGAAVGDARPRRRSGPEADDAFTRRRARRDRRQPAADPPAPARAGDRGRAARRGQRRHRARDRARARSPAPCSSASPASRPRRSPSRARSRCSARARACPRVAALAEVDEAALARAAAVLARTEILRPEPPLGFVHALVRDAVYRELPHGERALWHERAVRVLQALGAPANQVAAQLLSVPPKGDAAVAALLHDAGRAAFARGAPDSAVGLLARALAEPPPEERRPAILLDLGLSEMLVDGSAAVEHMRAAYAAIADPRGPGADGDAVHADPHVHRPRPRSPSPVADEVLAALPAEERDTRRRLEARAVRRDPVGRRRPRADHARSTRSAAGLDEPGAGARMVEAMVALRLRLRRAPGRGGPAAARARRTATATLLEADDGLFTVVVLLVYAMADRDEALGVADDMLARAHRRGSQFGMLAVSLWRGWLHLRRGELVDAVDSLQQALDELAAWHGAAGGDVYAAALHAHALLEHGDLDARVARASTRGCATRSGRRSRPRRWWTGVECELLLASGRPAEVLPLAGDAAHAALARRATRRRCPGTRPRRGRSTRSAAPTRRWRSPRRRSRSRARGARRARSSRALRELGEIRGEAGLADLEAAVAAVEGSPARLEHAKALAAHGRALRHARRPADAREPLRRALELADACGAEALAEDVRTELYAAGARPRTAALSGAGALTASERRVAALAAEGSSNRDIAQTLFVTPKTVEVHLSNAYRKLGIRSRRELTAALA